MCLQPLPPAGPLCCSWCRSPLSDGDASLLAKKQGGRHVFCSYDCGVELGLRAGSSRIIRQQLFALVRIHADVMEKKEGLEEGVLRPPCRLSIGCA